MTPSLKTALITGASSGIGRAFAHIHTEAGGDVVVVARRESELIQLKQELESKYGVRVLVIVKDLTESTAAAQVVAEVKAAGFQVDYLINNAGFGGLGVFHERDLTLDLDMINLNIKALTSLTHFYLQEFVQRNEGKILNVSSTASLMAGPLQAVYFATKAYVTSFSNALVEELRDTNVSVTNLMPGATATEFGQVSGIDKTSLFNKTVSAQSVAEAGYKGMLKGKIDVVAGLTFFQRLLMACLPFTPKKIALTQIRKMQEVVKE